MSTCDSLNSPEVEYVDNNEITTVDSIERKTSSKLYISKRTDTSENIYKRDILATVVTTYDIVDIDENFMDPQLCAAMACDIYKHLQASEAKKRPSVNFMSLIRTEGCRSLGDGESVEFVIQSGGDGRSKATNVTGSTLVTAAAMKKKAYWPPGYCSDTMIKLE
ncbi:hypothetical protein U1Q18_008960 [Sarracenia purpurea var. burkii]